jgi:hypothetical protein
VDGIATEIPEEIGVFFENDRPDAGASQQIAQHHSRRATAHDAALGRQNPWSGFAWFNGHTLLLESLASGPGLPAFE